MKPILVPNSYNYIGVFLTLRCNMACSYCLNRFGFFSKRKELTAFQWIEGLRRIQCKSDIPLTFQGGEPTIHPEFYSIIPAIDRPMDLLTNGTFDVEMFTEFISKDKFYRNAPYASIRISYHETSIDEVILDRTLYLKALGYQVGIWGVGETPRNLAMKEQCKALNIDFRIKEMLSKKQGTYKYPDAIAGGEKKVLCKPSEMLIAPNGDIYRCHSDLYLGAYKIGNILDTDVILSSDFKECSRYGKCNPCDVKLKTNRFQQGGHCSVKIKFKDEPKNEKVVNNNPVV